jgi:hypothetical protein
MRRAIAVVAAGSAFLSGLVAGNLASPAPVFCSHAATRPDAGPIGGGHRTTLREAQRAVSFTLLTHFGGANPTVPPSETWIDEESGIVANVYGDEGITMFMRAGQYTDLQAGLADLLPAISADAAVRKAVEGHWALLIDPDTDACGGNPAALETELYGTNVSLYTDMGSVDKLVAFANTLLPAYAK